ncbi:MAG: DDE-type integrase/transposase/recombinase [Spirosomataceae bacterium]
MLPSFNVENISISTIYNIFKKNNINKQPQEIKEKYKTFKEYDPGFLHIDVTIFQNKRTKTYLFVAIDRATRMIFYWIYENKNAKNAEDFLENV